MEALKEYELQTNILTKSLDLCCRRFVEECETELLLERYQK